MSTPIEIQRGMFEAATMCAATNDDRVYLNGVFLDFRNGRIASTNGVIAFIGAMPVIKGVPPMVVPIDFAKRALRDTDRKDPILRLTLEDMRRIACETKYGRLSVAEIDGIYPSVYKIVPEKPSGELAQFNPELLVQCSRALQAAHNRTAATAIGVSLRHNGQGAALMVGESDDAVCVVMP